MASFAIPAFGETVFHQHKENNTATVTMIPGAAPAAFAAYCAWLAENGAEKKQEYTESLHRFAAYLPLKWEKLSFTLTNGGSVL